MEKYSKLQLNVPASIIGYEAVGKKSAKVFIGSSRRLTNSEITSLFANTSLTPYHASCVIEASNNGTITTSVFAYKKPVKIRTKDQAKNFSKVTANTFYDVALQQTWDKKKDDSGNEYFVRDNDDNIQTVLSELAISASSMFRSFCKKPTVECTGYVTLFALNNNVPSTLICKVVETKANSIVVEADGVKKEVPKTAVIRAFKEAKSKQDVIDHLLPVYPPEESNKEFFRLFKDMGK